MADYKRENEWLREALEFKKQESYQMLVCEVIGRSPTNLFNTITINRGSSSGVAQGMAVMSGNGVVGTVQSVTATTATVILATDARSAIGGMVQHSGDLVLIEGDPEYSGMLLPSRCLKMCSLEVGDVLVTSAVPVFPKGCPIGKVAEIVPSRYQLSFTAYIEPLWISAGWSTFSFCSGTEVGAADGSLNLHNHYYPPLVIQTTVFAASSVFAVVPDLILVLVVLFSLINEPGFGKFAFWLVWD